MVLSQILERTFKKSYIPSDAQKIANIVNVSIKDFYNFSKTISIKCNKDIVEIPVLYFKHMVDTIEKKQYDTVDIPLYTTITLDFDVSFTDIMKECLGLCDYGIRLKKYVLKDYNVYYVGKGLILDDNFTPILYLTMKYNVETSDVLELLCYINPVIYYKEDVLLKGIKTKYLPFISTNNLSAIYGYDEPYPVTVIIKDFSDMFQIPTLKITTDNNESFNSFLKNNKREIISYLNID